MLEAQTTLEPEIENPAAESTAAATVAAAAGQRNLGRPSAQEIYQEVARNARRELSRTSLALAISGLAGGTFMGLSALGNAIAAAVLGNSPYAEFISRMFYPLGFIVVILGRAQLFSENTLYPVALVLQEKRHLWHTLRLWGVVLPANILGSMIFSALAVLTPALRPNTVRSLVNLGLQASNQTSAAIFWSAVMAGWIIAAAAWLISGSHSISGSIALIWLLTFVVGLGGFAHCIAGSGEVLAAILSGNAPWITYPNWFLPTVSGNILGGVGMVTILEYGQVIYDKTKPE